MNHYKVLWELICGNPEKAVDYVISENQETFDALAKEEGSS